MNDQEYEEWVEQQRTKVYEYLERQGVSSPIISDWPAFDVEPYFAIWVVESKKCPGTIGWWAFSGDCPTDYVAESGEAHPRAALKNLMHNWQSYLPYMKKGKQPPKTKFGNGTNLQDLGKLLESRVRILEKWHNDLSL